MRSVITIAFNEIKTSLRSSSFYFMAALFLFYQGIVFSLALVQRGHELSPPGPLLAPYFGGPFWFWPLLILIVVELSHGTIVKEKANDHLDILLGSPTSPATTGIGKYLGILAIWILLWLFTLPMVSLFFIYLPADTNYQLYPLVSGYLGTILVGAAGLALGLFFSTSTSDLKLSGMLTFTTLFLLVLIKIIIHPTLGIIKSPLITSLLQNINFFEYMKTFSKGIISFYQLFVLLGIIIIPLLGSCLLLGKKQLKHPGRKLIDLLLIFIIFFNFVFYFSKSDTKINPSRNFKISREFATAAKNLETPVRIYLFYSSSAANLEFLPLPQIREQLDNLATKNSKIQWEEIVASTPSWRVKKLAEKFNLNLKKIQKDSLGIEAGKMVIANSHTHKTINFSDLFMMDINNNKIHFKALRLESQLISAFNYLADPKTYNLCFSSGHGELSINKGGESHLERFSYFLGKKGWNLQTLSLITKDKINNCKIIAIVGANDEFAPSEIQNLLDFVQQGGNLLVFVDENKKTSLSLRDFLHHQLGVKITGERVFDQSNSLKQSKGYIWTAKVDNKLINKDLRLILRAPKLIISNNKYLTLLSSSPNSHTRSGQGFHTSGSTRNPKVDENYDIAVYGMPFSDGKGKVSVLGFIENIKNHNLDKKGESMDGTSELVATILDKMIDKKLVKPVNLKTIKHYQLALKSSSISAIQIFSLILMPLLFITIGIWIGWKNRR
ncbi:MAG: Gldg family protein [Myxococcota bacterium]